MSRPRAFDEGAVVDAALQAFWSGGLASTSVDELLQATGLSRSSMYQCIGNRDALLEKAVTRYVDEQIAAIERSFAGRSLGAALAHMLGEAAQTNFEGRGCLLANGVGELHEGDGIGLAVVQAGFTRFAQALRAAVARAAPRRRDSTQCCVQVMVAIAGLRTLQRAAVPAPMLRKAAKQFAAALARG